MPEWTRHLAFAIVMAVLVVGGTLLASQLLLPLLTGTPAEQATSSFVSFFALVLGVA